MDHDSRRRVLRAPCPTTIYTAINAARLQRSRTAVMTRRHGRRTAARRRGVLWQLLWHEGEGGDVAGPDHAEVPHVDRGDVGHAVALGEGDDTGVGAAE